MVKSKKITVVRLAAQLGLSETTVSLALSGRGPRYRLSPATIARVAQAAREMGYRPNQIARQLAGKRSNAIGVLINTQAVADFRVIQAMEILAARQGIRVIVGHAVGTHDQVKEYLNDFEARGVDGVIAVFHNHPDYRDVVLPELERFENVVFFEEPADAGRRPEACFVQPDYYEAGRLGVQHLLDRGRKKIALVFNNLVFPYAVERRRAYGDVLRAARRAVDPKLIWVLDQRPGSRWTDVFTPELALQAVDELVGRQGADGLVAVNDLYAARLLAALRQRGKRVPKDVAVVGCDHLDIGTLTCPTLTTIDLEAERGATATMNLMLARLEGRSLAKAEREVILHPRLVPRESS